MTTVTMIDVARHFAEYVDLVVNRGERFTLTRDGKPVAELGPVLTPVRLEDLPTFLASLPCLTPAAEPFGGAGVEAESSLRSADDYAAASEGSR